MQSSTSDPAIRALSALREAAQLEGLPLLRVTRAHLPDGAGVALREFVASGHAGDMNWLEDTADRRSSPDILWPDARSAIVMAQPYTPDFDPMARLSDRTTGVISVYALNRDYHDVFKGKLKRLAQHFAHLSKARVKVFVDTAPVMEKPLAAQAGLGWQGRHTNLVSREAGNWFFIGTILTNAVLPEDEAGSDHCGSCRACLDICPTKAFTASHRLDARRCISYLTIEHNGHIAPEFRAAMGNRIYGCDDCLAVCPWNKFAIDCNEMKLKAREDLVAPRLAELLALDDGAFRMLFAGSAVKRIGRDRFVRNCLIAAGNSADRELLQPIRRLLGDPSALVRAMAIWAHQQIASPEEHASARNAAAGSETDAGVLMEWAR